MKGTVCLSQKQYLQKVLSKFNINKSAKQVNIILTLHFKLSFLLSLHTNGKLEFMARVPYASVIDSLMCAIMCTGPDIFQVVSMISRYMHSLVKDIIGQ